MTSVLTENGFYGLPFVYNTQKSPLLHGPGNMVVQNRQKIIFSKYCPLKESHWSGFPKVSMRKLRNYLYRSVIWSVRRWRGWCLWTGRTATWSAAPCSTQTSAQSSGRCCTRPGAYLHNIYINYILSTTIYTIYLHIIYYYLQVGPAPAAAGRVPGP